MACSPRPATARRRAGSGSASWRATIRTRRGARPTSANPYAVPNGSSQLSAIDPRPADDHPYWLQPFQNYQTFCPYLVGSYDRVAQEVARYLHAGVATVILDVPASPEELEGVPGVPAKVARSVYAQLHRAGGA